MKNTDALSANIVSSGRNNIKMTDDYLRKKEILRSEITHKYRDLKALEKSVFKRLILHLQREVELKRAIYKLTSHDKLYLTY